jgi:uncharacterized protein YccT (UPF0319 family)
MGTELFLPPTHDAHIGYLVRLSVSLDFLSVHSRKQKLTLLPRKARVIVPNRPHHIVQRYHSRNKVESYAWSQQHKLTGNKIFVNEIEKRLGLRIEHRQQGLPKK